MRTSNQLLRYLLRASSFGNSAFQGRTRLSPYTSISSSTVLEKTLHKVHGVSTRGSLFVFEINVHYCANPKYKLPFGHDYLRAPCTRFPSERTTVHDNSSVTTLMASHSFNTLEADQASYIHEPVGTTSQVLMHSNLRLMAKSKRY